MNLSIGIVGLPNVGKSTLFNALTKNNVLAANYPFATIEPNTGVVAVPDERLTRLTELSHSAKTTPAIVTFVDIAGLVAGAHKGEGMGNAFLSHIRETDAIAQVVRVFEDSNVQHVSLELDPRSDIETINTELILADIQTLESHIPKVEKQAKGDKSLLDIIELLKQLRARLDQGQLAINSGLDLSPIKYLNLLTNKQFIYVFNVHENDIANQELMDKYQTIVPAHHAVFISAKIEAELAQLPSADVPELMSAYGLKQSGLVKLSQVGYEILNLQSFLTTGEKETRAWTIAKGTKAPQAAGTIHGDFERGFIAADCIAYSELIAIGSWSAARTKGKIRTEGKDYVMRPDDVVEFKFNV